MKSEDLILKGNQLMLAARDGKIGLAADEVAVLQKAFIAQRKLRPTQDKFQQIFGSLVLLCGLMMFVGMIFGGGGLPELLVSVAGLTFGGLLLTGPIATKRKANEYIAIVEREYPKISKGEVA